MSLGRNDVISLFDKARAEMFVGPLKINVKIKGSKSSMFFRKNAVEITVPPRLLGDPEGGPILLWYFRHNLAHMHYCPYNLRTVLTLARVAQEEVGDWRLSYTSVALFSDLQIDMVYLPLRYRQLPLHLLDEFYSKPKGVDSLRYTTYLHIYKNLKKHRVPKDVFHYGAILGEVILSYRPWTTKVKTVAMILKRLDELVDIKDKERGLGSSIPLSEDLENNLLGEARRVMSSIRNSVEAKEFYYNVIRDRLDVEVIKRELREALKGGLGEREEREGKEGYIPRGEGVGEEPELPSTLSRPLSKIKNLEEAIWRSLWYRALAEKAIIEYGEGVKRGTWSIYAYADLWTVEDDVEELDLEASMEEGPIIPEVNTLRPIYVPSPSGEVIIQAKAPAVLVVLDSSKSMLSNMDEAAVAAYIAYLSARRMGGKVAVINFSTRYVAISWESPGIQKELVLALRHGELTILPLTAIKRILKRLEIGEVATLIIVTDCGWQNLREALGFLEKVSSMGHRVIVFHLEGGKYPRSVEAVVKSKYLTLYLSLIHI